MLGWSFLLVVGGRGWNPVRFRGPGAEVNLFAALRAERAPAVGGFPYNAFATLRTLDDFLDSHQRLQKVSSKVMSCSTVLGRVTVSGRMKRMLSAYLLALISGTAASEADMRTRSI